MNKLAAIVLMVVALGGCLTRSAMRQAHSLIGRPLGDAVALYGPPDEPVTDGAQSFVWSRGRLAGACRLSVKTDASGRIVKADIVALGFSTCNAVLMQRRAG